MVILDTDHMTLLEWARGAEASRLRARLDQVAPEERVTTIISFEEQTRGWLGFAAKARSVADEVEAYRRLSNHLAIYRAMAVLDFDERAAVEYQRLRQAKIRVGPMDLKIAAIALAHDATLLSRNLRDFERVPGLKVEDWTAEQA
ncbi:MAG TPA: type II toxin-antitoxin system VapC family toxin [Gemmataceae bacterium]|nr:type II toxin-antitoxin system VapC family toxin [Gemmataceae bacterium]